MRCTRVRIVVMALLAGCWRTSPPPAAQVRVEGPAPCLPGEPRFYRMARVGADIVLCGESDDWDVGWT